MMLLVCLVLSGGCLKKKKTYVPRKSRKYKEAKQPNIKPNDSVITIRVLLVLDEYSVYIKATLKPERIRFQMKVY